MADISLPLRAWPPDAPGPESVSFLISQINAQRGSFRSITEESLAEEAQTLTQDELGHDNKMLESIEKSTSKVDDIMAERQKLRELVAYASASQSRT